MPRITNGRGRYEPGNEPLGVVEHDQVTEVVAPARP